MATSDPSSLPAAASTPAREAAPPRGQAVGVALKAAGALAAAYGTALAIAVFVPETNDYAQTARIQQVALTSPAGKKIVLIGGSNLTYGAVSPEIEAATGCPVANMGLNGRLGVNFMLSQAEHNLRAGDIAVIALEYDTFLLSPDGDAGAQLVVAKTEPATFGYLSWRQKLATALAAPQIAQLKVFGALGRLYDRIVDPEALTPSLMREIETVSGVTPNGDLVSHIGVTWPYEIEDGFDLTNQPVNPGVIAALQGFAERMEDRGVHVLMSYTPVMQSYYDRHHAALETLHATLAEALPAAPPSRPYDFAYEPHYFFDTVYHLNGEGREIRTRKVIEDLHRQLGDEASCHHEADATVHGGIADD